MVHWRIHPYSHGQLHITLQHKNTLVMWLRPLMEKQRGRWGNIVCMKRGQDTYGTISVCKKTNNELHQESQTLAEQGLMFLWDCETLGSESERLLQHSYHILKLRQCDGTEHNTKKSLSLQLKSTVNSLREKHCVAVLIIHTVDETQICALLTYKACHLHL